MRERKGEGREGGTREGGREGPVKSVKPRAHKVASSPGYRVKCPISGHFLEIELNTVIYSMHRNCSV